MTVNDSKNKPGRPSKFDEVRAQKLLTAIRAGCFHDTACSFAGIHYSTFRRWIIKGQRDKSGAFHEFARKVETAESDCETRLVAQWQQHFDKDWRAILAFLERRYPEKWARRPEKGERKFAARDERPLENRERPESVAEEYSGAFLRALAQCEEEMPDEQEAGVI